MCCQAASTRTNRLQMQPLSYQWHPFNLTVTYKAVNGDSIHCTAAYAFSTTTHLPGESIRARPCCKTMQTRICQLAHLLFPATLLVLVPLMLRHRPRNKTTGSVQETADGGTGLSISNPFQCRACFAHLRIDSTCCCDPTTHLDKQSSTATATRQQRR